MVSSTFTGLVVLPELIPEGHPVTAEYYYDDLRNNIWTRGSEL